MPSAAHANSTVLDRIFRVVPALDSLRSYDGATAKADLVAGITVATVAVPQAMAYAMVAGLPPEYGLYTAIVMTGVGALFDSSKQLINGPTNAISIALLSAIAHIDGTPEKIETAIALAFLIGLVQLAITLLRLGDLSRYISHSVIVGFTAGAGMLLVLDQLKNLLGLKGQGDVHDHFLVRFWRTLTEGGEVHGPTLTVGLLTIAAVVLLRVLKEWRRWTLLPELLIVVGLAAGAVWLWDLEAMGVMVVGEIPAKLPSFGVPALDRAQVRELGPSALAIGVLGLLEAIAMAKAIAAQTRQKLDINQQCLSEGLANTAGSLFHCMPGSGSLTRSAINQQAGARTQWSGVISAAGVAGIMLLCAPAAAYIPKAALAGILIVSAWRMVDRHTLLYHLRVTRFDALIVSATAVAAVAVSIEFCVLIGTFLSFMLTVPRAGRMLLTEFMVREDGLVDEVVPQDPVHPAILIFGFEGEMFFGAASALEEHFETIEGRVAPETRVVVLRLKRVRSPDAVCLTLLDAFLARMKARRVKVLMCGVRTDLRDALESSRIAEKLDPDQVFAEQAVRHSSTLQAIHHAYEILGRLGPTKGETPPPTEPRDLYFVV